MPVSNVFSSGILKQSALEQGVEGGGTAISNPRLAAFPSPSLQLFLSVLGPIWPLSLSSWEMPPFVFQFGVFPLGTRH